MSTKNKNTKHRNVEKERNICRNGGEEKEKKGEH